MKTRITMGIVTFVLGLGLLLFALGGVIHSVGNPQSVHAQAASSFVFSAAGDYGFSGDAQSVMTKVGDSGSDFHIVVGDVTYGNTSESNWCSTFKSKLTNIFIIAGNHDTGESSGGDIDLMTQHCPYTLGALPNNPNNPDLNGKQLYGKRYYFDYPLANPIARFIMIGPGLGGDKGSPTLSSLNTYNVGGESYKFTQAAIDDARANGIKWIIVGMHKNCFSTGQKTGCAIGSDLKNLLFSKRVDLVIQGHDHNYQRSKQLATNGTTCTTIAYGTADADCIVDGDNNYVKGQGTVTVIQGGGGAGLYPVNSGDGEAPYFGAINSDTKGPVKYTVTDTQITAQLLNTVGAFTDSFTITDCANCPTPTPTNTPTPAPGVDLIVTDISWTPATPTTGDAVTFKATMKNQGPGATPNGVIHGVRFSIDGVLGPWSDTYTTSIPAGGSVTVTATGGPSGATWTATQGNHTITAWVDDQNRITETTETNNTLDEPLVIAGSTASPTPTPTPGACPQVPTDLGVATTTANIPGAGNYVIWSRINPWGAANSYYLQVDDQCAIVVGDSSSLLSDTWSWVNYRDGQEASKITMNLTSGDHTIKLVGREPSLRIDRLLLTTDQTCIPQDTGTNCDTITVTPTTSPSSPTPTVQPTSTPAPTTSPATPTPIPSGTTTLVPFNVTWRYLDNGSDQGTVWSNPGFDDTTWKQGPAELGYGDGGEATVVSFGPDSANKYITTYFRKTFTITDPTQYSSLSLQLRRDDGGVVYINGTEVFRNNMPTSTITYSTPASSTVDDAVVNTVVNANVLQSGTNTVAVEMHQRSGSSSDLSFDLSLIGNLQGGTPTPPPASLTPPLTTPTNTQEPTPTGEVLTGDVNKDGTVDLLDFNIWRDEFLGTVSTKQADFNSDGIVDLVDFNVWLNAYRG